MISEERIRLANDRPVRPDGDYVLYWMTANRRRHFNASLERAVELCNELGKPLFVLEALRTDYPWASDRLHRFVIEGMRDNEAEFQVAGVRYYPFLERKRRGGKGLLRRLSEDAAAIVTDDFPCFFLPRMVAAAAAKVKVRMELVDGNGLWPIRATERVFTVAHSFRRHLHKELLPYLEQMPVADPLEGLKTRKKPSVRKEVSERWPRATVAELKSPTLADFPIDHGVGRAPTEGGPVAGRAVIEEFLEAKLDRYDEDRNQPQIDAASGLSPYLHFGHVSVHDVFARLAEREDWSPDCVRGSVATGQRHGFWGMSQAGEAFLDEVLTWRELGYNKCALDPDYDRFESLPDFAQKTLTDHAGDPREHVYTLGEFEKAATHDPLWNAAQNQLRHEGRIHNYLRMLWGKKILEWSVSPQEALATMIELNNKYALDGRNPNSYSGIFWVLGRYDRAWGPERPIFGKVRYMSSDNTARKVKVKE